MSAVGSQQHVHYFHPILRSLAQWTLTTRYVSSEEVATRTSSLHTGSASTTVLAARSLQSPFTTSCNVAHARTHTNSLRHPTHPPAHSADLDKFSPDLLPFFKEGLVTRIRRSAESNIGTIIVLPSPTESLPCVSES